MLFSGEHFELAGTWENSDKSFSRFQLQLSIRRATKAWPIADSPPEAAVTFLLDTAATQTMISPEVALRLGVELKGEVPRTCFLADGSCAQVYVKDFLIRVAGNESIPIKCLIPATPLAIPDNLLSVTEIWNRYTLLLSKERAKLYRLLK